MKIRIISALILAPLIILAIFFLPFPLFMTVVAAIVLLAFWEWGQFISLANRNKAMLPGMICFLLSLIFIPLDVPGLSPVASPYLELLGFAVVWWLVASTLAITYPYSMKVWQNTLWMRHLFGVLTLIPFFWSIVLLRAQNFATEPYHGAKLVLFVCLLVWAADTGAYFTGKMFGKHKMAPKVSPNKTVEGLLGGIIAAIIVSWAIGHWFGIEFSSVLSGGGITLCTVVISVLGDLVESMFKRAAGIKDSSHIIPGHGGILDRVDSLTAAFPVFTLLYFTL